MSIGSSTLRVTLIEIRDTKTSQLRFRYVTTAPTTSRRVAKLLVYPTQRLIDYLDGTAGVGLKYVLFTQTPESNQLYTGNPENSNVGHYSFNANTDLCYNTMGVIAPNIAGSCQLRTARPLQTTDLAKIKERLT